MREIIRNLNPVDGVASGATPTVEIATPEPMRLHGVNVIYMSDNAGTIERRTKAVMLTELDKVEAYINNKRQAELHLDELFEDEEMRNETVEDGVIPLRFSRDERETSIGKDATAFITGIGDTLRLKIFQLAATSPDIDIELLVEPLSDAQIAAFRKRRSRQIIETVSRGQVAVNKIGKMQVSYTDTFGRDLSCMKLRTTDCSYISIYRGNKLKWEGTPEDFDRHMRHAGYTPQAGVIHFFPEAYAGGRFQDLYQYRNQQLRLELTMDAANSFDAVLHEVGDATR